MSIDSVTSAVELDEGDRLTVYDDATGLPIVAGYTVKGNPTIGYGTLLSEPGGITQAEASMLLDSRIARSRAAAQQLPGFGALNSARQDVLVEMTFQLGFAGISKFHQMIAAYQRGDFAAAALAIRDSHLAQETPARAERYAKGMETGIYA